MRVFEIGEHTIGNGSTYVIAEAGSNHNNDFEKAKELIDVAATAGADAVKFQSFRAATMYPENSGGADYLDTDRSLYEIVESMEMPYEWIPKLYDYCNKRDLVFLSTPTDERAVDELDEFVPAFKIASFTMSHHSFLEYVADRNKPVILSTGAHELREVEEAVELLQSCGVDDIALMHCVSAYPTPMEAMDVRVVRRFIEEFDLPSGLSDHTIDPSTAPAAAVSLGANVIEKHFTLDKTLDGPDHRFALEPDELSAMVDAIRRTETVLGSGEKRVLDVEAELHDIARRRIHATRSISPGEKLTQENTAVLRSGKNDKGLDPKFHDEVLGLTVTRMIEAGGGITWDDLEEE